MEDEKLSVSWFTKDASLCPVSSSSTSRLHLILKLCQEILNLPNFQVSASPTSLKLSIFPPCRIREAMYHVRKSMALKWSQEAFYFNSDSGYLWCRTNYFQTSIVHTLVWNLFGTCPEVEMLICVSSAQIDGWSHWCGRLFMKHCNLWCEERRRKSQIKYLIEGLAEKKEPIRKLSRVTREVAGKMALVACRRGWDWEFQEGRRIVSSFCC